MKAAGCAWSRVLVLTSVVKEDKLFYFEDVRFYLQKLLKNFCQELFTC